MTIKPYIIIPNLIKQPTWGGTYIFEYKNTTNQGLLDEKIGQSYELYESSNLSTKITTKVDPSLELSDPKNPENVKSFYKDDQVISIKNLIQVSPTQVLGEKYTQKLGDKVKTLIKLNQAKGNSYQIHVNKPTGKWFPKPESWFFLENGLVSLGVKKGSDWDKYHQICSEIDQLAKQLGQKVVNKELSLDAARKELGAFIEKNNPEQFVNLLEIDKGQAIDLSKSGIHHSWEENDQICPRGNIVYEVQENVYDDVSTIRSFDKGKIKEDGSTRDLQIEDYFQHVDRSAAANTPQNHVVDVKTVSKTDQHSVQQIFSTPRYAMQKIDFTNQYADKTTDSFHHLFVRDGEVVLESEHGGLTITQGFSVFVPASTGEYRLKSPKSSATVLKTYL